jgi:Na+/melibiose symporter-like transporter
VLLVFSLVTTSQPNRYYYESIGAKLTYIAAYVAIARSFDVITDPAMGWLTDNTHSKFGRRKPYMAIGTVFYNACLLLLLSPPKRLSATGASHWFGFTYTAFFLFDTFTSIPYFAFGMEMTNNFAERDQLWFWNSLSGNLGTLFGMALPAALTAAVTSNLYTVFVTTAWVFIAVHASGMAGNLALIQEKPPEDFSATREAAQAANPDPGSGGTVRPQTPRENAQAEPFAAPFVVNLLRCLRNEPFNCIIRSYLLDYLALGMVSAMTPFYVG